MAKIPLIPQKPFDSRAPIDADRARKDPAYKSDLIAARGGFKQKKINVSKVFGKRDELSRFAPIVKYNPNDVENAVDDSPDSISKRVRIIEKYIHDVSKSIETVSYTHLTLPTSDLV